MSDSLLTAYVKYCVYAGKWHVNLKNESEQRQYMQGDIHVSSVHLRSIENVLDAPMHLEVPPLGKTRYVILILKQMFRSGD